MSLPCCISLPYLPVPSSDKRTGKDDIINKVVKRLAFNYIIIVNIYMYDLENMEV